MLCLTLLFQKKIHFKTMFLLHVFPLKVYIQFAIRKICDRCNFYREYLFKDFFPRKVFKTVPFKFQFKLWLDLWDENKRDIIGYKIRAWFVTR